MAASMAVLDLGFMAVRVASRVVILHCFYRLPEAQTTLISKKRVSNVHAWGGLRLGRNGGGRKQSQVFIALGGNGLGSSWTA